MQEHSLSPHPFQNLLFADFLVMSILTNVRWYLIIVLIFVSLVMNNVEYFFMFVSHLCVLWKNVCLDHFLALWWCDLFFWYWVVWAACIFWKLIPCQLFNLLLFPPIMRVVFNPLLVSFAMQKLLSLIISHLLTFVFISITLGGR